MRSKSGSDGELANLPEPTVADVIALENAERHNVMSPRQYLDFLMALTKDLPARRNTNDDDKPFEL
jgi:hypothetical protein